MKKSKLYAVVFRSIIMVLLLEGCNAPNGTGNPDNAGPGRQAYCTSVGRQIEAEMSCQLPTGKMVSPHI